MVDQQALLDDFEAGLAALPGVEILAAEDDVRLSNRVVDRVIKANVKGQFVEFVVEAKAYGYPRDVRQAADQLLSCRRPEQNVVPVVIAPSISEGSRVVLQSMKIGYWDTGGSFYVDTPNALYWIDRAPPPNLTRRLRNVFRGRAAQVLHAMLLKPNRQWHISELATYADVAPSTVHQVFTFLEDEGWLAKVGSGPRAVRELRDPVMLLDAWAQQHSLSNYAVHRFHAWAQRPSDLLPAIAQACDSAGIDYALTLDSGGLLVAPFVSSSPRLTFLADASPRLLDALKAARLKPVDEGENVLVLATRERSPLMFRQNIDDVWVASDVQLYLDLWASPQRGKEQARHLRAARLSF
jgi:hypothetical protein